MSVGQIDELDSGTPLGLLLYGQGRVVVQGTGELTNRWDRFVHGLPDTPDEGLVLASADAAAQQGFADALVDACHAVLDDLALPDGVLPRIWLALNSFGPAAESMGSMAQQISDELGCAIIAPDGPVVPIPGSLFTTAGTRWWIFSPGRVATPHSLRYPVAPWEHLLPTGPISAAGLMAHPVPAGLLVRPEDTAGVRPLGSLLAAPRTHRYPRVLLDGERTSIDTSAFAELLMLLPESVRPHLRFVPSVPAPLSSAWLTQLASLLGHDVNAATGLITSTADGVEHTLVKGAVDWPLWQPFAAVLAHSATGSTTVIEAGSPPAGWRVAGPTAFRCPVGGDVLAKVIPAGLALLVSADLGTDGAEDLLSFDRTQLTITVGRPGTAVHPDTVAVLAHLCAGLSVPQREHAIIWIMGHVDGDLVRRLDHAAGHVPVRYRSLPEVFTEETGIMAIPFADGEPDVPVLPRPHEAAMITRPELVFSGGPAVAQPVVPPVRETGPDEPGIARLALTRERRFDAQYRSTDAERSGLMRLVGPLFDGALPSVNSALAAAPALRYGEDDPRADLVAVNLYVGDSEFGAPRINHMLRSGDDGGLTDYVACLASGLRRLPVYRGAAFRFARLPQRMAQPYEVGEVVDEPGFVSATGSEDLTLAGDCLDVVIWSYSARRAAAFGHGSVPDEVVFTCASRFKVLAVRVQADRQATVLMRELRTNEDGNEGMLDDTDVAIMDKIDRALDRRSQVDSRILTDQESALRLGVPIGLAAVEHAVVAAAAEQPV